MKILAIDTSTLSGSVALCDGEVPVAEEQLGSGITHSESLMRAIEDLLGASGWQKNEIEGIAVAIGPGSFTGLRIGLATAKGMALALARPIAGASSLLTMAYNGLLSGKTVVPVIDARRGEVYGAAYRFEKGSPRCLMEETVCDPALFCGRVKSLEGELFLTGDGAVTYEDVFKKELKGRAIIRAEEMKFPHAANLARITLDRLKRGGDDIKTLVPNYLRHSDAEIGFKGKGKKV
jgi:tRNA threonylcarbamoyladenosine biosynthesis protein TsaB